MNVEISQSGLDIKEESTENEIGVDDGYKLSSFLYVDMNDYNEHTFDVIDLKEEEEQVEDLTLVKNTSVINDTYFEENLPLNPLINSARYSKKYMRVTKVQTVDKNDKKEVELLTKQVHKESISGKTLKCSGYKGDLKSKRYTLRTRTLPQKINLDLLENISDKRRNVKLHNKAKTTTCSKFKVMHAEDGTTLSDDIENRSFNCLDCGACFSTDSLWNAHITVCKTRTLKSDNSLGLDHENYLAHNNQIMSTGGSKDHKEIPCKCEKHKRTFKDKCNFASNHLKNECHSEKYICALCDKIFLKKNTLKKHIIAHLNNKIEFQQCCQSFTNFKGINNHICMEESKNKNLRCKYDKKFLQPSSQNNQNKSDDNECPQYNKSVAYEKYADYKFSNVSYSKMSNCQICKKSFKGITSYRKHLKSHKDVESSGTKDNAEVARCTSPSAKDSQKSGPNRKITIYKCDACGKLFIRLVKLKIHILNVHQGVNYQCEKCSVKFLSQDDLNSHQTKEEDCRRVDLCTCNTCGKVFAKRDYLKKHQYMHMNVLFKCKYCYCAFMKEKSYKKHMEKMNCSKSARKIRMAEFNYKKCRLCEVEYETEELLIKHFKVSHTGLEPHQCFCCDSCLPTFLDLQNHIHQHNIQKYTCNLCGKPYTSQEGFRKHRLKHKGAEFKCKFCESEFLNENRFKFHEKTCKKNPVSGCDSLQGKEKVRKKDSKPKQSRQLHWESRIIMKRLRGDPTMLSGDQKYPVNGQQDGSLTSTFFDEPESETTNERGWFDNYYKTEEDDIAFGLRKADELAPPDCNSEPDVADVLQKGSAKKKKTSSPPSAVPSAVNSDVAEGRETEAVDISESSSEDSSTDSDEEIQSSDFPIDYNPKKCRFCVISFGQEYELLHHFIKSHPGEFAHECPHCGVKSPLYAQLKEHMKTHGIGIGIFNCDNCSKQFKSEKKMNSHNIRCKGINNDSGTPEKVSVSQTGDDGCKRCGKKFHTKFGYRRHKQLCKKKKNKNSEKLTAGATRLSTNEETLSSGLTEGNDIQFSDPEEDATKTTECAPPEKITSVCKEKVAADSSSADSSSAAITKHRGEEKKKVENKSNYSGEPPMDSFPCRLCDKKFQYERGIVMHFKTAHPGNKPLICHVCNMHLADKLKEHLKTHGIGEEFICELCGKRFNQKFLSKIHEIWHQGIEYKCNNCKQKFLNKEKMDKHIAENRCSNRQSLMRLPCDICGKSYRSKFGLSKHYITHTPKELRPVKNRMNCEYCGKWFENNNGLQRHRRIHTGERPFCCRFCPKAFAQEGNCKAHERIHTGESKPRKKKLPATPIPPTQTVPATPLIPQVTAASAASTVSTVSTFSFSVSTVETISYPGHITLYNYNIDPSKIVH